MNPPALAELADRASIHHDLHVYDVTLRDGIQAPGATLSPAKAGDLAAAFDMAGVRYIEAGIPIRSDEEDRIRRVRDAVVDGTAVGLAEASTTAVDAVIDADLGAISIYAGGSPIHRGDESLRTVANRVESAVAQAIDHDLECRFAVTDAGRTPAADLWSLLDAAECGGADMLGLTDTVGLLTPRIVSAAVSAIDKRYPHPVSVHLHNDLGAAAGNAIAAAEAGVAQVHTTVDGLGPMAGNTALAPFATAMALHHDVEPVALSSLPALSEQVAAAVGLEPPPATPITGENVFRYTTPHRADRARQDPSVYEGFSPAVVGRERRFGED